MKKIKRIVSLVLAFLMVFTATLTTDFGNVSVSAASSTVTFTKQGGWFETAYAEWDKVTGATEYRAYVKKIGGSYTQLDDMLLRQYSDHWRVDAVGLAAGTYQIKVEAKVGSTFVSNETGTLTVKPYDRSGFAFSTKSPLKGDAPGAYNTDGTLKAGAQVLYVTEENKKTVQMQIGSTTYTGVAEITQAIKDKNSCPPVAIRIIGKVTLDGLVCSDMSSAYAIGVKQASNVTFEGIGEDATLYGGGVAAFTCNSIEIRNLGLMNWGGGKDGDGISLKATVNAWIHNVDFFYGDAGKDGDQAKGDGSMDLKDNSQYVTISYNHFWDSGKMSLCGMKSESGPNWITYHHNWFDHSDSRHPRIRTMSVHVYNNYFDGNSKYGVGAAKSSEAFVENNYFRNCKYPMLSSMQGSDIGSGDGGGGTFSSEDGGVIKSYGNIMEGTYTYVTYQENSTEFDAYEATSRDEKVPSTVKAKQGGKTYSNFDTDSSIMYDYTPDAATDVPTIVMNSSGRMNGGDFNWTFDNSVDDESSSVNTALKTALNNYTSPVVSIGGGDTSDPTELKGILISPSSKTLLAGGTVQLTVSPSTSQATLDGKTVTYESSNTSVATVSSTGLVTAVAEGTATITAKVDSFTADCAITVSAPVALAGIKINETAPTVQATKTIPLTASATNATTDEFTVTWSSANTGVATVNASTGVVTGVAEGTAVITATATTTGGTTKTANVTVTVTAAPPVDTSGFNHVFATSGLTSTFYTFTGCSLNSNKEMKMESSSNVSFTAPSDGTLTLVYGASSSNKNIKLDGTKVTSTSSTHVLNISAGAHTLTKADVTALVSITYAPNGSSPTTYTATLVKTGLVGADAVLSKTTDIASTDSVTVTITPTSGYTFATAPTVTVDGASAGAVAVQSDGSYKCNITGFTKNTTVTVAGEAKAAAPATYTVSVVPDGNGTASASKTTVNANETVTLTATPATGYKFKEWTIVSGTGAVLADKNAATTTLTVASADVTVKATFERKVLDSAKVKAFVTRFYTVVLNRQPDENGIADWTNGLLAGTQNGASASYGFVFSDEFEARNLSNAEKVDVMYATFLDRAADADGKKMWVDALDAGVGLEKIYEGFVMSTEFASICDDYGISAGTMSDAPGMVDRLNLYRNRNIFITEFVARCYTKALGRARDIDGVELWCRMIITGEWTPRNVAASGFINSDEFLAKNTTNKEYVEILYRTFFDREADTDGLNTWLSLLDGGMYTRDMVLDGFAGSDEFNEILASFGLN